MGTARYVRITQFSWFNFNARTQDISRIFYLFTTKSKKQFVPDILLKRSRVRLFFDIYEKYRFLLSVVQYNEGTCFLLGKETAVSD